LTAEISRNSVATHLLYRKKQVLTLIELFYLIFIYLVGSVVNMTGLPEEIEKLNQKIKSCDSNCYQWISTAAYFKAEARNFGSGKELEDWVEAEIDYIKFQIELFVVRCKEDGGMSLIELQQLGRNLGIDHPERIKLEAKLIRKIQEVSMHRDCFQSQSRDNCEETGCHWRTECQKLIADWLR